MLRLTNSELLSLSLSLSFTVLVGEANNNRKGGPSSSALWKLINYCMG